MWPLHAHPYALTTSIKNMESGPGPSGTCSNVTGLYINIAKITFIDIQRSERRLILHYWLTSLDTFIRFEIIVYTVTAKTLQANRWSLNHGQLSLKISKNVTSVELRNLLIFSNSRHKLRIRNFTRIVLLKACALPLSIKTYHNAIPLLTSGLAEANMEIHSHHTGDCFKVYRVSWKLKDIQTQTQIHVSHQ